MKTLFFTLLLFISYNCFSQYIGVKARYTETRLVDDSPNPPKRENRLILSFFEVTGSGNYIPITLSNYDIWVYKVGLQYGSLMGGVLDSSGNNYPGYAWPAPKAVAYFNSYYPNYIDCDPNAATRYTVNGHDLDCGFITVSYWDIDYGTGNPFEAFPAPNVCLPYYLWPHPYAFSPGNANFSWPVPATAPYNWYSFACAGSTQQVVIRGVLQQDSATTIVILPVNFANVKGEIDPSNKATISWSNLTESDILQYDVERSIDGTTFHSIGMIVPTGNNGGRADYKFISVQPDFRNYYRVKAIETSGGILYSSIIYLTKTTKPQLFTVNPNPVTNGQFTFRLTNAEQGRYVFSMINSQGQQIKQQLITHSSGDINRQVDITGLPPGVYQLVLWSATERFSQKIITVY